MWDKANRTRVQQKFDLNYKTGGKMKMSLFDKIKDVEIWKLGLMFTLLIIMIVWSGYTIQTKWGSIYKNDTENAVNRKMTKIKAQTNYSKDMKMCLLTDLAAIYEEVLLQYCKENNINATQEKIASDVKYYRLIVVAMSDSCEDITIERFIHNNDLYRYTNINDWNKFKQNVVELYLREGHNVLTNYYDNSKVIMPLNEWLKRKGKDLAASLGKNTDKLLEDLKTESVIYYNLVNNIK